MTLGCLPGVCIEAFLGEFGLTVFLVPGSAYGVGERVRGRIDKGYVIEYRKKMLENEFKSENYFIYSTFNLFCLLNESDIGGCRVLMVDSLDSKKVIGGALGRHIRSFQLLFVDWWDETKVGAKPASYKTGDQW